MKDADKLSLRDAAGGSILAVKVVPCSSRDRIAGVLGDSLKVATSAAPEKGKANAAVAKIIAKALALDARAVTLHAGQANPRKEFLLAGLSAEAARERLGELP
jgi:uncharacterized protein YggU (UPF0235/DUF167 family)